MLSVKLLPAGYGDCILLSTDDAKPVNILIDGGLAQTYDDYIKKEAAHILELHQKLNLVICTHIDNDHISGLIELLNNKYSKLIDSIWYNGLIQMIDSKYYSKDEDKFTEGDNKIIDKIILEGVVSDKKQEIGINSGLSLGVLIDDKNIALNTITSGKLIYNLINVGKYKISERMYISIIGPSLKTINELECYWKDKMAAKNYMFRIKDKIKMTEAFEYQLRRIKLFYAPESFKISEKDDLKDYIGDLSEVDSSIINKSSISFILEYNEKKFLFLGDAVVDENLLANIKKNVGNEYHFAAIKLPHHGSRFNISHEFIRRYTADEYFCLTNSEKFNHPDLQAISAVICENSKFKKIIFNYPIKKALFLNNSDWKNKYNYDTVIGNGINIVERKFI